MPKLTHIFSAAFASVTLCLQHAGAASIVDADATGADNFSTIDYWGVAFAGGSGDIASVTFDLTATPFAFFDFDGNGSFGNATGPILGTLSGLSAADISFSTGSPVFADTTHPAVLTFDFAPNAFTAGDSFRFSADTEALVADPTPGGLIGEAPVNFSVSFSEGTTISGDFGTLNDEKSVVRVAAEVEAVPEGGHSAFLFSLALAGTRGVALWRERS